MNNMDVRTVCQRAFIQETGLRLDTTLGEMTFKPGFILTEREVAGYSDDGRSENIRYEDILDAEIQT
jgi:hypothetical protein